jgi:hypothetical protein
VHWIALTHRHIAIAAACVDPEQETACAICLTHVLFSKRALFAKSSGAQLLTPGRAERFWFSKTMPGRLRAALTFLFTDKAQAGAPHSLYATITSYVSAYRTSTVSGHDRAKIAFQL